MAVILVSIVYLAVIYGIAWVAEKILDMTEEDARFWALASQVAFVSAKLILS
jgi:hypothetical protein